MGPLGFTSGRSPQPHSRRLRHTLMQTKTHLHTPSLMRVCALTEVDIPVSDFLHRSHVQEIKEKESGIASMCQQALKARCKPSHVFMPMLCRYTRKSTLLPKGLYLPCFFLMYSPPPTLCSLFRFKPDCLCICLTERGLLISGYAWLNVDDSTHRYPMGKAQGGGGDAEFKRLDAPTPPPHTHTHTKTPQFQLLLSASKAFVRPPGEADVPLEA